MGGPFPPSSAPDWAALGSALPSLGLSSPLFPAAMCKGLKREPVLRARLRRWSRRAAGPLVARSPQSSGLETVESLPLWGALWAGGTDPEYPPCPLSTGPGSHGCPSWAWGLGRGEWDGMEALFPEGEHPGHPLTGRPAVGPRRAGRRRSRLCRAAVPPRLGGAGPLPGSPSRPEPSGGGAGLGWWLAGGPHSAPLSFQSTTSWCGGSEGGAGWWCTAAWSATWACCASTPGSPRPW